MSMEIKVGLPLEERLRELGVTARYTEVVDVDGAINSISALYPGARGHAGHDEGMSMICLPVRVTDDDINRMNKRAAQLWGELSESLRGIIASARDDMAQMSVVPQYAPFYPTLLPAKYGTSPADTLRDAARQLKKLLTPTLTEAPAATATAPGDGSARIGSEPIELVWWPGVTRRDLGYSPDAFSLRRFSRRADDRVLPGEGICYADIWGGELALTPEDGQASAQVVMTMQLVAAALAAGRASVDSALAVFGGGSSRASVDYVKAWHQVVIGLFRGTTPSTYLRASYRDLLPFPSAPAGVLPQSQRSRPAQLQPAMFRRTAYVGTPGRVPAGINVQTPGGPLNDAAADTADEVDIDGAF